MTKFMMTRSVWLCCAILISVCQCVTAQPVAPAPTPSDVKAPLPPAEEIIARFVKEIGGKAAYAKVESQRVTGKFDLGAQGINGVLEVFAKRPDKLLIKITLPGLGEMLQGYDGKVGWTMAPMTGPMVLEGKALEQARDQARFDAVLHDPADYKSMQTVERTTFEGKDCYKVKLVRRSGQEAIEYYEVDTGLLAGSTETQETPLGAIPATAITSDYKKFGDLLFATKLVQKTGPIAQVMTFEKMEFNNVDDGKFELPDAVKALLKK